MDNVATSKHLDSTNAAFLASGICPRVEMNRLGHTKASALLAEIRRMVKQW